MAITLRSAAGRLKLAVTLVIALATAMVVVDVAIFLMLAGETDLISTFGWGHVPRAKIQPLVDFAEAAPVITLLPSLLRTAAFGYFLFWSAKALDLFGITHRFSRWFTGFSIIIPFVGLYLPWAALGEARGTFELMAERQSRVRETIREFHFDSFLLGLVWIGSSLADRVISTINEGPMNATTWHSTLSSAQTATLAVTAIDIIALLASSVYCIGFFRSYRRALAIAVTDVFTEVEPAKDELPAYTPVGDPVRS